MEPFRYGPIENIPDQAAAFPELSFAINICKESLNSVQFNDSMRAPHKPAASEMILSLSVFLCMSQVSVKKTMAFSTSEASSLSMIFLDMAFFGYGLFQRDHAPA